MNEEIRLIVWVGWNICNGLFTKNKITVGVPNSYEMSEVKFN